jgi:hypothetical protein
MRRWSLGVVIVLAACVGFGSLRSHAANDELKDFMRIKLKHSQDLLTGLVLEDFDQITKNAEALSLLTLAESWQVFQTPDYMEQSAKFRKAADALTEAAKKKNLDEATVAYNRVTSRCVECHKYVRAVRMARAAK